MDGNLFGIDILKVREINRTLDITPVQHSPAYVRGLVNLRGQTITVFDLGTRLGLASREMTADSHNIILKEDAVGLLVDNIRDVLMAGGQQIEPLPFVPEGLDTNFIEGILKMDSFLLLVLSVEKLLETANG